WVHHPRCATWFLYRHRETHRLRRTRVHTRRSTDRTHAFAHVLPAPIYIRYARSHRSGSIVSGSLGGNSQTQLQSRPDPQPSIAVTRRRPRPERRLYAASAVAYVTRALRLSTRRDEPAQRSRGAG